MPILKREIDVHPRNLFDEFPQETDRRWFAVYTKVRQEKALARELVGLNVPFYLPQVERSNLIKGRKYTSLVPLFPSYLFVFGNDDERIQALSTQRIAQLILAPNCEHTTRDLRNIRQLISSGEAVTIESRLEPGRRVRVKSGSLLGMEGTIVARRGMDRLLVSVEFLQQGVSIEIGDFQVEPL